MFDAFLQNELDWPRFYGKNIVELRQKLNITSLGLAKLLGVELIKVVRWERDEEDLPKTVNLALAVFESLGPEIFKLMSQSNSAQKKQFLLMETSRDCDFLLSDDPSINLQLQEDSQKFPDTLDDKFVKELRNRLGLSQVEFARLLDISLSSLVKWENGSITPKGPALILLKILWKEGIRALP